MKTATLYEDIAGQIAELIRKGTLTAGGKVPSIRQTSQRFKVSISTVIRAYRLLEDRHLIEARPQSGFIVRDPALKPRPVASKPATPQIRRASLRPTPVKVWNFLAETIRDVHEGGNVPLGGAVPAPEFLPIEHLNRILARVVRNHPHLATRYEPSPGNEELRAAIARRMFEAGCQLGPDEIFITTGATEAIFLALQSITRPGDTVAVESPGFFGTLHLLERLGLRAVELPVHPREGVVLKALERLVESDTRIAAVVLNSTVQNPMGSVMSPENKQHAAELLADHGIPLIEDDTYGDLAFADARPPALKSFDRNGDIIYCSSFSKTLAPGYRVGWIVPGRWMDQVHKLKLACSLGSCTAPQLAVADYLTGRTYERHLKRIRRLYQNQMTLFTDAIARYFPKGSKVTQPAGGHVLWIELPAGADTQSHYETARAKGLTFAPGPMFSSTGRYRNCLRLNAGFPWSKKAESALKKLGALFA